MRYKCRGSVTVEHVQDTAPGRGTHASECIAGARVRQFFGSMKSRAWGVCRPEGGWHAGRLVHGVNASVRCVG